MKHNYNSTANQNVKGQLVSRDVYYCQTFVVEKLLENNPDEFYELENSSYYVADLTNEHFEGSYDELEDLKLELEEKRDRFNNALDKIENKMYEIEDIDNDLYETINDKFCYVEQLIIDLESDIDSLEHAYTEYAEIYEWWLVSDWLANKLKEYGQVVYEDYGSSWWGRQATGQGILLDHVISMIAESMGILEGQENHEYWV